MFKKPSLTQPKLSARKVGYKLFMVWRRLPQMRIYEGLHLQCASIGSARGDTGDQLVSLERLEAMLFGRSITP